MKAVRSYLFVPGDSARKMDKAAQSAAHALILDLEDSVAEANKAEALATTCEFLRTTEVSHEREFWVRLNAADPARALAELAALPLDRVTGVFHPKLEDRGQLNRMGDWLDALEARDGVAMGSTGIVGIITETATALVGAQASSLAQGHPRLRGYSWGTEDLSAALGRVPLPGATPAQQLLMQAVQMHCLLMAAAAGIDAIDTISANFRDMDALADECDLARELGYVAKMAIHPAQLEPINTGLAPDAAAIEWAQRVQALREENPDAASFSLDGRMVDEPHMKTAAGILARRDEK
ncbi:citrate lyase subunit beta [Salinisphaera dokdonensis CL-ES53]|uniref:Citrate lyase subunit beta n=1 Tax=Salinisphaera dokdonensis CL-ES53 TaxID=1304272 RepID=A0ABV2B0Z9_9GAMM